MSPIEEIEGPSSGESSEEAEGIEDRARIAERVRIRNTRVRNAEEVESGGRERTEETPSETVHALEGRIPRVLDWKEGRSYPWKVPFGESHPTKARR